MDAATVAMIKGALGNLSLGGMLAVGFFGACAVIGACIALYVATRVLFETMSTRRVRRKRRKLRLAQRPPMPEVRE